MTCPFCEERESKCYCDEHGMRNAGWRLAQDRDAARAELLRTAEALKAALAREARLREALDFYADEKNWDEVATREYGEVYVCSVGPEKARVALAAISPAAPDPRDEALRVAVEALEAAKCCLTQYQCGECPQDCEEGTECRPVTKIDAALARIKGVR